MKETNPMEKSDVIIVNKDKLIEAYPIWIGLFYCNIMIYDFESNHHRK